MFVESVLPSKCRGQDSRSIEHPTVAAANGRYACKFPRFFGTAFKYLCEATLLLFVLLTCSPRTSKGIYSGDHCCSSLYECKVFTEWPEKLKNQLFLNPMFRNNYEAPSWRTRAEKFQHTAVNAKFSNQHDGTACRALVFAIVPILSISTRGCSVVTSLKIP